MQCSLPLDVRTRSNSFRRALVRPAYGQAKCWHVLIVIASRVLILRKRRGSTPNAGTRMHLRVQGRCAKIYRTCACRAALHIVTIPLQSSQICALSPVTARHHETPLSGSSSSSYDVDRPLSFSILSRLHSELPLEKQLQSTESTELVCGTS